MFFRNYYTGPYGVNTYLLADDQGKGFIVDPGGQSGRMENDIREQNIEVQAIVLTHSHGDHIGGMPHYEKMFPKAKIVACIHEKELMEDPAGNESIETCGHPITPNVTDYIEDGDTMEIGGLHLQFLWTPGHTPGSMCIYVEKLLLSGDTLFCHSIGRTDLVGGNTKAIFRSIKEKLYVLPDSTPVFPGHGEPTTITEEKTYNPFVR